MSKFLRSPPLPSLSPILHPSLYIYDDLHGERAPELFSSPFESSRGDICHFRRSTLIHAAPAPRLPPFARWLDDSSSCNFQELCCVNAVFMLTELSTANIPKCS